MRVAAPAVTVSVPLVSLNDAAPSESVSLYALALQAALTPARLIELVLYALVAAS